jgi:hypothetical protein
MLVISQIVFAAIVAALAAAYTITDAQAKNWGVCGFSDTRLKFAGSTQDQAKCLLRKVRLRGSGSDEQPGPASLLDRVGTPVPFDKVKLRSYLRAHGINEDEIGGSLDGGLRSVTRSDGARVQAMYFIIHDTSSPEFEGTTSFPGNINDAAWSGNRIATGWVDTSKRINNIVNRAGKSRTFVDFAEAHAKNGTKIEGCVPAVKALFIQVENIQPRIKPRGSWGHIAPSPGFSDPQMKRLALIYVAASLRGGTWMVPAFHFNIDHESGCGGHAHDDPQNFDLARWVGFIEEIAVAVSGTQ